MADRQPNGTESFMQNHYALRKLAESVRTIHSCCSSLPDYREKISNFIEVDKKKAQQYYQLLGKELNMVALAIEDMRSPLLEIEQPQLSKLAGKLALQIKSYQIMTSDYSKLISVLSRFASQCDFSNDGTVNAKIVGRLMNNIKMGYYPTSLENIGYILNGIAFPDGTTTNLLDPCCGCGSALKKLAIGNNCYTYGIELDEARAEEAQGRLHRVGFGSFFHSRISREKFHVVFLNPPYLSVMTEGGTRSREEKRFLIESIPHLVMGGLLIYVIPYYRLTPDICRILCDNFADLSLHRFTDDEFRKFRQIVVMGLRKCKCDGTEDANELYNKALELSEIPCITDISDARYVLPDMQLKVDIFKGEIFNQYELARQLKESKSFDTMFAKSKLDTLKKRPLLPLSIGQVGLIGGSGLINGLIDCEYPHIIKGRVVKQRRNETFENNDEKGNRISTEVKETVSNKMIFNILTPNGFQSLN